MVWVLVWVLTRPVPSKTQWDGNWVQKARGEQSLWVDVNCIYLLDSTWEKNMDEHDSGEFLLS